MLVQKIKAKQTESRFLKPTKLKHFYILFMHISQARGGKFAAHMVECESQ